MNKNIFTILFICTILSCACEEETDKTPNCSVSGLWTGTWATAENTGGTFFGHVAQENIELTGNVYIRFDLPSLENYGAGFSGEITDRQIKSFLDISNVDIKITGIVENDKEVNGNFETLTGLTGTYTGKKIPTYEPVIQEIYCSESNLNAIVYINNRIWVFTSEICYDDESRKDIKYVVKRIDTEGNLTDTVHFPFTGGYIGNNISYDGEKIWFLDGGYSLIYTYDTAGNQIDTFPSPAYYADAIACIDNQVYITDGYNRVTHILNPEGIEISDFPSEYVSVHALCEYNGSLLMAALFTEILLKTDMNGEIIAAYILPDNIFSICSNGEMVWCLSEEYISDNNMKPGTYLYTIYALELN